MNNVSPDVRTREEKRAARHRIYFVGGLFAVLFLSMMVYICSYALTHQAELFENDYNGREQMLLGQNRRGTIYAADGQILAQTVTEADGTEKRVYPFGSLFAQIVGYDVLGRSGVEALKNRDLVQSGLSIAEKTEYDSRGEKYPGNDVVTTLDPQLQQAAGDALGIYKGAIIVTEVSTGRILACVSRPDYDPNTIRENWAEISGDSTAGRLLNRAAQGMYPPGSTFKIVDALEYLQEKGETGADSYHFVCSGTFSAGGETIHCYHGQTHGTVSFDDSFAVSCNSSFANMGLTLDRGAFAAQLDKLYFGKKLPCELQTSVSSAQVSSLSSEGEVMQLSIGQGETTMSPLHLNMITAMVANHGVMMRPYVVERVQTASGTVLSSGKPRPLGQLVDAQAADRVAQMMREVVTKGTGRKLSDASYEAAGKTGSAEFKDQDTISHAWFTGFAPASDPQICVTVVLEGAGSGGDYAVPMARRVLDAWFLR